MPTGLGVFRPGQSAAVWTGSGYGRAVRGDRVDHALIPMTAPCMDRLSLSQDGYFAAVRSRRERRRSTAPNMIRPTLPSSVPASPTGWGIAPPVAGKFVNWPLPPAPGTDCTLPAVVTAEGLFLQTGLVELMVQPYECTPFALLAITDEGATPIVTINDTASPKTAIPLRIRYPTFSIGSMRISTARFSCFSLHCRRASPSTAIDGLAHSSFSPLGDVSGDRGLPPGPGPSPQGAVAR